LVDTAVHWSIFGQMVILCLIQIGGLGFMTISLRLLLLLRRRVRLRYREVMVESINSTQIGGVLRLTKEIVAGTIFFLLAGGGGTAGAPPLWVLSAEDILTGRCARRGKLGG